MYAQNGVRISNELTLYLLRIQSNIFLKKYIESISIDVELQNWYKYVVCKLSYGYKCNILWYNVYLGLQYYKFSMYWISFLSMLEMFFGNEDHTLKIKPWLI